MLSLGASSFGDSDLPQVQFANSGGFSAKLPATSPNPLQVAVPIYINPATGKPDSGTVSLTVIYPDGTTKAVQGTLTIAALPTLAGVAPGAVTEAFLEGTINLIASSQSSLDSVTSTGLAAAALVTPAITAYLTTATTRLMIMQAAVSTFLAGKPGDSIGSITTSTGSLTLRIDTATMYTSDRIIAAFLNQIAPAGQGLARRLPVTVSEAATDYLDFARTWNETLTSDISDQWLDWGKKVGSTIGTVTAVTGLAVALAASTPAITAVGTTAAVIGAMGYAVSTFAPAVSAVFLRVGSSILLNGQASQEDYMPETKFVIENTAAQGASFWLTSWVEEVDGELSSAVVGALDDQAGITAKVGTYVAGAVDLVYPPDTGGTCVVTISPKAKTFIYSGGNGTLSVTAGSGCAWKAKSSATWITVISGSVGSGKRNRGLFGPGKFLHGGTGWYHSHRRQHIYTDTGGENRPDRYFRRKLGGHLYRCLYLHKRRHLAGERQPSPYYKRDRHLRIGPGICDGKCKPIIGQRILGRTSDIQHVVLLGFHRDLLHGRNRERDLDVYHSGKRTAEWKRDRDVDGGEAVIATSRPARFLLFDKKYGAFYAQIQIA